MSRNIAVIGLGHVGLPTLVALSVLESLDEAWGLIGYDTDTELVKNLNGDRRAIGLDMHSEVRKNLDEISTKTLITKNAEELNDVDIWIVAVPSFAPEKDDWKKTNPRLLSTLDLIYDNSTGRTEVVIESTLWPGANTDIMDWYSARQDEQLAKEEILFSYSPSRVNPSAQASDPFKTPKLFADFDVENSQCSDAFDIYAKLYPNLHHDPISPVILSKLIENAFRLVNISFINQVAFRYGSKDVLAATELAMTKGFGYYQFTPSAMVGGPCLMKDTEMLADVPSATMAVESNRFKPSDHAKAIATRLRDDPRVDTDNARVCFIGLTFKPNTTSECQAPAKAIFERLAQEIDGVIGHGFDPLLDSHKIYPSWCRRVDKIDAETVDLIDMFVVCQVHPYKVSTAELAKVIPKRKIYDPTGQI